MDLFDSSVLENLEEHAPLNLESPAFENNDTEMIEVNAVHLSSSNALSRDISSALETSQIEVNAVHLSSSNVLSRDISSALETSQIFSTRDELLDWARDICIQHGTVITILKYDGTKSRRTPRLFIGCERSLKYIPNKKTTRKTSTKKCDCPFRLKGTQVSNTLGKVIGWKLEVLCGIHNHELEFVAGRSVVGKLKPEEKKIVRDMSELGVKPSAILSIIKEKDPNNRSTIHAIYNARMRMRLQSGRKQMKELMKYLEGGEYVTFSRRDQNTQMLVDLFCAHPMSIRLATRFPKVFMVDCTYKTNRSQLALLSIVGITSTTQNFYTCFSYLSSEKENSFTWALETFKSFLNPNELPLVFICDGDQALINALKKVFPIAKNMICVWHISKCLHTNCRKEFEDSELVWTTFVDSWNALVNSANVNQFEALLKKFQDDYKAYPKVLNYVNETWLTPYKEYFISAWTDKNMHLGNKASSGVEGAHEQIKKEFQSMDVSLPESWRVIDNVVLSQIEKIKVAFEDNKMRVRHVFNIPFYKELIGNVAKAALELIEVEKMKSNGGPIAEASCDHKLRQTHGLPCAHQLSEWIGQGQSVPLSEIDMHWRKLSFQTSFDIFTSLVEKLKEKFMASNESEQMQIIEKLDEILDPKSTYKCDPPLTSRKRGRPRGVSKKHASGDFF